MRPDVGLARGGSTARNREVKAALSAMVVKTDRKDARGIVELLRIGGFAGPLQVASAQEVGR